MKNKNYNIEMIRFWSFVMVIIIHVANYYCRAFGSIGNGEYFFSLFFNVISRVSVPCFFMISGALLLGRNEAIGKSMKRAGRMLLALVIWSVIYYLFNTCYMQQTVDWKHIYRVPAEAHMWYLYVIIPIYLMMPFLQAMCRGMDEKTEKGFAIFGSVLVVVLYLASHIGVRFYYDMPILGNRSYIYYVFMGYWLSKNKDKIWKDRRLWFFLWIGSSLITTVSTMACSVTAGKHYDRLLEYGNPLVVVSAIAFFLFVLQKEEDDIPKKSIRKVMEAGCACSFGIYLIHGIFLDIFKKQVEPIEASAFWMIPVLVIVLAFLSFACIYIVRKSSVGRKIT